MAGQLKNQAYRNPHALKQTNDVGPLIAYKFKILKLQISGNMYF